MNIIKAPYLRFDNKVTALKNISETMDVLGKNLIANAPWLAFPYKPDVQFRIAHYDIGILLKFIVKEKFFRATYTQVNAPVYKDSCVEFFISFDVDKAYYNFEFNAIGTCLLGYGERKLERTSLPVKLIQKIRYYTFIKKANEAGNGMTEWELTIKIPLEVFRYHNITSLKGLNASANFYKCGDELPEPHFLSWNNVIAPSPDFHLPEFFGAVHFV